MRREARAVVAALTLAGAGARTDAQGASPAPSTEEVRVELIGVTEIPRSSTTHKRKVGGLSGLAYREADGRWFAVSDDKKSPRLYELTVEVEGGAVRASVVRALPLPDRPEDAEGLAWDVDRFVVSYERPSSVVFLRERAGVGGRTLAETSRLAIPPDVASSVRLNRGFESVTIVAVPATGAREVWVGTESSLPADGPAASARAGAVCRVLVFDLATGARLREHAYRTLPAPESVSIVPSHNTLTDLAGLPDGRLLALERSFTVRAGYDATIRLITPGGDESDLRGEVAARAERVGGIVPLRATEVGEMSALGAPTTVNWEGLGVGPRLTDDRGGRLLLVVSDNNFGADGQGPTKLAAFRLLGTDGR